MANIMKFLYFPIFSCLALFTQAATFSSNQTDLLSLMALKEAIVVDPNRALSSWNQTSHFCSWIGITCGRRHPDRVVAIRLYSRGLIGSISPHIGNLSFLRLINLRNNSFNGRIPQEIFLLRRLRHIEFSNNSFLGAIPKNISQSINLVYLNLIDNNLSGTILGELENLEKLAALGLSNNEFSGHIPQFIGNLTSLTTLSLSSCGLSGEIPESMAQLHRLSFLQLSVNNLSGIIPPGLFNISSIEFFEVAFNYLQGSIPSTIGATLPNLRTLLLGQNQLTGIVPSSISNASSLESLMLSSNYFTGLMPRWFGALPRLQYLIAGATYIEDDISFISSLTNCTKLQVLNIADNPLLSGRIPDTIANLSKQLYFLGLDRTQLGGVIPEGIGNLVGLSLLRLSNNMFEGPIPSNIGRLYNLHILDMGENKLTSHIPSTFGNLTLLTKLYLQGNNFSRPIPRSIGNCSNLLELYLSRNSFSGSIPREIFIPSISISLDLSYNAFTGSVAVEVGSLTNLASLNLSNNKLSGLIPNSLGMCISLEQLNLEGNLFEGQIPPGLSSLIGLIDLDLSRNRFSGSIPSFLTELRLQKLNISFNRLQGEVPIAGVFKDKTRISVESNTQLCGGILELNLPPCRSSSSISSKKKLSTPLKIVIPIAGVAAIILCLVIFYYRKRTPNGSLPSASSVITGIPFLRLSYADLLKSTNGFSENNLVGLGRFGSVYRGIIDDGQTVIVIAAKVLNLVVKGASKSFVAECNALREIRHRNLVKILSVCESIDFQGNDFKALVYEFKANGSLDKWLYYINSEQEEEDRESDAQLRNLDLIERLNIAIDVAQALEYLHCGTHSTIVHGDLKPSNILLDQDMIAFVGDFGISKIISSILPPTESNSSSIGIRGTLGYVPPEYGMSNSVSTKGDVYSYGILVLEMFTTRRPTDDSFGEHGNLHNYVVAALPHRVMEIVDPLVRIGPHKNKSKFEDCMCSILKIGLSCSMEMPRDRMSTTDVVNELNKIKKRYISI